MTLAQWVSALNVRLKDASNALFTAAEKEAHVEAAVREYGRYRPRLCDGELTLTAGVQRYAL
ncbi:MAG: hypothetical protein QHJ73_11590, partial [Armatimonadota bacterium]|nr:hypothetical protein [Armatimonadota bacterium]